MPKIPDIAFDDITVAQTYTGGHSIERCRNSLWGIYNVIKRITVDDEYQKVLECLYMIGANATFADVDMTALAYVGKTNKKYKRNMPAAKYLFKLEKYGFTFSEHIKTPLSFIFTYNAGDFSDVIFGLKRFSDICLNQSGDCFYTGDIRVAFEGAPKLYAPPVDEVFGFLPEEQKQAVYSVHGVLEKLGCIRNLEREYMTKYMLPKKKLPLATIYAAESLYFLPDVENNQKVAFKLNLRNIGRYADYLSDCTEAIRQAVLQTIDCYGCKKACGGIRFVHDGKKYSKCPFYAFRFLDCSEKAVENYCRLTSKCT